MPNTEEEVKEYQRRSENGQTVTVRSHARSNEGAAAQALTLPGRPPIAARIGTFPNGRSTPGVFSKPPEAPVGAPEPLSNPDEHGEFGKRLPDHLRALMEPQFDAKTGKPLKKIEPPSKKTQKVVAMAASLALGDDVVSL